MEHTQRSHIDELKKRARSSVGSAPVLHLRSGTLSLCTLFSMSKAETADIVSCLEAVDATFTKTINIFRFCDLFCPRWKHTFQFLFAKYETLPFLAPKAPPQAGKGRVRIPGHESSYFRIISFLILLIPLGEKDYSMFFYLLCFEHMKTRPKSELLSDLVKQLWGSESKEALKAAVSAKFVSRSVDIEGFDSLKLESYNTSSKGAFFKPIIQLISELKKNVCNKKFWSRIMIKIHVLRSDRDIYFARLERVMSMLEASEDCHFTDGVDAVDQSSRTQLNYFSACFCYVHKIDENVVKSLKHDSSDVAKYKTVGDALATIATIPVHLYQKYFGEKSIEAAYRHQQIVPFRGKKDGYKLKGYSAKELFDMCEISVLDAEESLETCADTLEEGIRQNKILDAQIGKMVKADSSKKSQKPYGEKADSFMPDDEIDSDSDSGANEQLGHVEGIVDGPDEEEESTPFARTEDNLDQKVLDSSSDHHVASPENGGREQVVEDVI